MLAKKERGVKTRSLLHFLVSVLRKVPSIDNQRLTRTFPNKGTYMEFLLGQGEERITNLL